MLHFRQAQATLLQVCVPPLANATICSNSGALSWQVPRFDFNVLSPQMWHIQLAFSNTAIGSIFSTLVLLILVRRAALPALRLARPFGVFLHALAASLCRCAFASWCACSHSAEHCTMY